MQQSWRITKAGASNLICLSITLGLCKNADSYSLGPGWGPRLHFIKFPGDADADAVYL